VRGRNDRENLGITLVFLGGPENKKWVGFAEIKKQKDKKHLIKKNTREYW